MKRNINRWFLFNRIATLCIVIVPVFGLSGGCGSETKSEIAKQVVNDQPGQMPAGPLISANDNFEDITSTADFEPATDTRANLVEFDSDTDAAIDMTKGGSESRITFTDVTANSGIDFVHTDGGGGKGYIVEGMASGIICFDYNNDGLIDIYFLNGAPLEGTKSTDVHRNRMYRNNGDWTFTDVTEESGLGDPGFAFGGTVGDYDGDGRLDIFVNNFGPNVLFENDGCGSFSNVIGATKTDCDQFGAGVVFSDFNGDGALDLYVANYVDFDYSNYRSRKSGKLESVAAPQDYDELADVLFLSNRDVDVMICADNAPNLLSQNDGNGVFTEVGLIAGVAHDLSGNVSGSKGAAFDDLDNDGDIDIVLLNANDPPSLLKNELKTERSHLTLQLAGKRTNRDGINALVKVFSYEGAQVAEVHSGRGYQSHYGTRLHFGFAEGDSAGRIEVNWLAGGTDVYELAQNSQNLRLIEGGDLRVLELPNRYR